MVNTAIACEKSKFAEYELEILEKNFNNLHRVVNKIINAINSNPYEVMEKHEDFTKDRDPHKLVKNKKSFEELMGFWSIDVTNKYRLIFQVMYDSNEKAQNIDETSLPEKVRTEIYKSISDFTNNNKADRYIFIYILNVFFNTHDNFDKNIATCSIDYFLHQNELEVDKYSPFKYTKYSLDKFDEYEYRLANGLPLIDDSLIARLVRTHNELSQGIIKRI